MKMTRDYSHSNKLHRSNIYFRNSGEYQFVIFFPKKMYQGIKKYLAVELELTFINGVDYNFDILIH